MIRCVSASRPLPWFQSQIKQFIYFVPWGVYSLFPFLQCFLGAGCILSSSSVFVLVSFRPCILSALYPFVLVSFFLFSVLWGLVLFLLPQRSSFLPNILASSVFSFFFSVFRGLVVSFLLLLQCSFLYSFFLFSSFYPSFFSLILPSQQKHK